MINELLTRLKRDRYGIDHAGDRYALGWNDAMGHVERVVGDLMVAYGLQELADAPALDLRLRAELTGGVK